MTHATGILTRWPTVWSFAGPRSRSCVTSRSTCLETASSCSPGFGIGQVLPRLRHHLRRGSASLRRVAFFVRPSVPRADGQARRGLHRGAVTGDLHRPEIGIAQSCSTVGTVTEIYDYLRLLYARIGEPHCPKCGRKGHAPKPAANRRPRHGTAGRHAVSRARSGRARAQGGVASVASTNCPSQGFARVHVDGEVVEPPERANVHLARYETHTIAIVVDRLIRRDKVRVGSPTRSRPRSGGVAEGTARASREGQSGARGARRRRDDHVLPAPRVRRVRALLRRAGATELLVQLTLRRLSGVARARDPVTRSTRSSSFRIPLSLATGALTPWAARASSTSGGAAARRRGPRHRRQGAVEATQGAHEKVLL